MIKSLEALVGDESGATAVEYGLIAALVSIAGIAAFTQMGSSLDAIFSRVAEITAEAGS